MSVSDLQCNLIITALYKNHGSVVSVSKCVECGATVLLLLLGGPVINLYSSASAAQAAGRYAESKVTIFQVSNIVGTPDRYSHLTQRSAPRPHYPVVVDVVVGKTELLTKQSQLRSP